MVDAFHNNEEVETENRTGVKKTDNRGEKCTLAILQQQITCMYGSALPGLRFSKMK